MSIHAHCDQQSTVQFTMSMQLTKAVKKVIHTVVHTVLWIIASIRSRRTKDIGRFGGKPCGERSRTINARSRREGFVGTSRSGRKGCEEDGGRVLHGGLGCWGLIDDKGN